MNTSAEVRIEQLGIALPAPPKPLGAYVPSVQVGNLLFLSGTLPLEGGVPKFQGRIGADKASTRMVSGVSSLPAGSPVVVEMLLAVSVDAES